MAERPGRPARSQPEKKVESSDRADSAFLELAPPCRTPPRIPGAERTVRHRADGSTTVAVVVRGRPHQAVVADLIEGIVVANELTGAEATRVRTHLWAAVVAGRDVAA